MLQENHTREDETVVLRMLERVRVPRRNHADSNKVGTTTRNACAVWRTKPTARTGIISAGRIHVGHSNFRYQTRRSVRRLAPRDPQRIAAAQLEHQCSDSRTMTTPVGSGSWGFRLVRVASLQLARLTISPV